MNLQDLYQQAAEVITEKPVKVEFVDSIPGYLGKSHKSNGTYVIRVCTEGNWHGILRTFLHECAHVKLQATLFKDVGKNIPVDAGKCEGDQYEDLENEAQDFADALWYFAKWHAWRFNGSETAQRLKALINKDLITERARQRG